MRATISDSAAMCTIRPVDIASYLRQAQWTEQEQDENKAIWTRDDFEVLVPLNSTFRDYPIRMAEVLDTLSAAEKRPQLELFEDLTTSSMDVIRLHLIDPDVEAGSVPLEDAAMMGTRARDLLSAAACAAKSPRPVYGPKRPDEVSTYIRSVRMGQTEHGSYVLKLLSPVPPYLSESEPTCGQLEIDGIEPPASEQPFARRVTMQLAIALDAARASALTAAGNGRMAAFEEAVRSGVSANLCDAIAGFAARKRRLDISISWALSRPVSGTPPSRITFAPDTFPTIEEAARLFRESAPREDFEVYGPVVKCQRDQNAGEGEVTVHAFVEERLRRIAITLDATEYGVAVDAHRLEQPIRCTGRLVKDGKDV